MVVSLLTASLSALLSPLLFVVESLLGALLAFAAASFPPEFDVEVESGFGNFELDATLGSKGSTVLKLVSVRETMGAGEGGFKVRVVDVSQTVTVLELLSHLFDQGIGTRGVAAARALVGECDLPAWRMFPLWNWLVASRSVAAC